MAALSLRGFVRRALRASATLQTVSTRGKSELLVGPRTPELGSFKLLEERVKVSEVKVSTHDIRSILEDLTSGGRLRLFPVTLGVKANRKGLLKDILFRDNHTGFSALKDDLYVHVDEQKSVYLPVLFEDFPTFAKDNKIAARLYERLVHLVHQQFSMEATAGLSTELADKAALRDLMIVLCTRGDRNEPILFADEVVFNPPSTGPHGILDLVVGVKNGDGGIITHPIIVKHSLGGQSGLKELSLEEDKSKFIDLSDPNSSHCVQPVVQIVSVSQMKGFRNNEPTVLFFGNRTVFRPYIYFRSNDILLTTTHQLEWHTDDAIAIDSVIIGALLVEAVQGVKYRPRIAEYLKEKLAIPSTGFMEAMGNPERLAGSELKVTLMPKLPSFKRQPKHDEVDRTSEVNSLLKDIEQHFGSNTDS